MDSAVGSEQPSLSGRAWAWWMLAATALLCLLVMGMNAAIDPTARLGTGVGAPSTRTLPDRAAKLELLARSPTPGVVVLGSSRTKKLDPAWLGPVGAGGINAAVVGGDLFEARVLTAWLAERTRTSGERFPQLIVGIDVEQFRDSSLQGSGMLQLPAIERIARREAGLGSETPSDRLRTAQELLLSWQTTRASIAAARARLGPAAALPSREHRRSAAALTHRGVLVADRAWLGAEAGRLAARGPARIDRSIADYRTVYGNNGARLDAKAVDDLHAIVRHATAADGPAPVLYITPAHPRFAAELAEAGRSARMAAVLGELARVGDGGRARIIDCSSCIDGLSIRWIDAVHPSPLGMQQLAGRLAAALDQAPSATPTERLGDSR